MIILKGGQNMSDCVHCKHFAIVRGEDLCTYAKCMKTSKRGKTLSWRMTYCYTQNPEPPFNLIPDGDSAKVLIDLLSKRKIPKWCPCKKEV